jgi:hypothetical protein
LKIPVPGQANGAALTAEGNNQRRPGGGDAITLTLPDVILNRLVFKTGNLP